MACRSPPSNPPRPWGWTLRTTVIQSGCPNASYLYLDIGSNIGVQVRKLFEPEKYPHRHHHHNHTHKHARAVQIFEKDYWDAVPRASNVCALGMEPNPHLWPRLQALEEAYNQRGFRTHFYRFAAWTEEGTMDFHADPGAEHHDWGAHLRLSSNDTVKVRTVDLIAFLSSLPRGKIRVMKLDIEGAEWQVLEKAIPSGVLCSDFVGRIMWEAHAWGTPNETWRGEHTRQAMLNRLHEHNCSSGEYSKVSEEDESYGMDMDENFGGAVR